MKRYVTMWVRRILVVLIAICLCSACRHTKKTSETKKSVPAHTTAAETPETTSAVGETVPETTTAEETEETTAGASAAETTGAKAEGVSAPRTEATTAARKSLIDWDAFFAQLTGRNTKPDDAGKTDETTEPTTARKTAWSFTKSEPEPAAPQRQPYVPSASLPIYYEDDGLRISVTKQWYVGAWCYVAHVQMTDFSRLKTGMARDAYGYDELPASFASRHDCLLCVNGDYAEGDRKGVLRAGNVYSSSAAVVQGVYSQQTGQFTSGGGRSLSELVGLGYTDSFGFGAGDLVVDGESVYLRKDGGKSTQRTLIGTTGTPGDLYIVVTEGRYTDGASRGLQYFEAGDLLESLGCSFGIAVDGGVCSAMVWNGQVINRNPPQETTGFIYLTKG